MVILLNICYWILLSKLLITILRLLMIKALFCIPTLIIGLFTVLNQISLLENLFIS